MHRQKKQAVTKKLTQYPKKDKPRQKADLPIVPEAGLAQFLLQEGPWPPGHGNSLTVWRTAE